tara:strand:- start:324 stop:479 length:156 start_codon:yes stop_codon:yes gene_type:complete
MNTDPKITKEQQQKNVLRNSHHSNKCRRGCNRKRTTQQEATETFQQSFISS